jgi:hypothetical protein
LRERTPDTLISVKQRQQQQQQQTTTNNNSSKSNTLRFQSTLKSLGALFVLPSPRAFFFFFFFFFWYVLSFALTSNDFVSCVPCSLNMQNDHCMIRCWQSATNNIGGHITLSAANGDPPHTRTRVLAMPKTKTKKL